MAKLADLQKTTNLNIIKDISKEAISIDLIEKRKKTAELKVLMQLAHTQREIDIASEFFDCIDNFDEGTNLVEVYTTWFLNNKTEENPDRMECLDPNSMNTTDKIYINGLDNMTSIKTLKVSP